ncbi:MAG TPA: hypothetical protein VGW79_04395 [Actinomycetota bacterium]|nr:hypothetical protein [Actinomycetota bacterium]
MALDRPFGSPTVINSGVAVAKTIDPTKVTRLGLQNAASIASLILTTDCIIAEESKADSERAAGMSEVK